MKTKKCTKCGRRKSVTEFNRRKKSKDGYMYACRPCHKEYHMAIPVMERSIKGTWLCMMARCHNPNSSRYSGWGARGIVVCDRWHNYENFRHDMGVKPSVKHQIDRMDNDGDYTPENCRWVTAAENIRNRPSNKVNMDKAREIRLLKKEGMKTIDIANKFGIGRENTRKIIINERWREMA